MTAGRRPLLGVVSTELRRYGNWMAGLPSFCVGSTAGFRLALPCPPRMAMTPSRLERLDSLPKDEHNPFCLFHEVVNNTAIYPPTLCSSPRRGCAELESL